MQHSDPASRALTAVKVTVAGVVGGLVFAGLLSPSSTPDPASSTERLERTRAAAAQLASRGRTAEAAQTDQCAVAGAAAGSALIRTPGGRLRVVSFEHGWSVYKGEEPGTFVAVCPAGS